MNIHHVKSLFWAYRLSVHRTDGTTFQAVEYGDDDVRRLVEDLRGWRGREWSLLSVNDRVVDVVCPRVLSALFEGEKI